MKEINEEPRYRPMLFAHPADYDTIDLADKLEIHGLPDQIPTRKHHPVGGEIILF